MPRHEKKSAVGPDEEGNLVEAKHTQVHSDSAIQEGRTPTPSDSAMIQQEELEAATEGTHHATVTVTMSGEIIDEDTENGGVAGASTDAVQGDRLPLPHTPSRLIDTIGMYQAAGRAYAADRSERRHSMVGASRTLAVGGYEARRSINPSMLSQRQTDGNNIVIGKPVSDRYNLIFEPLPATRRGGVQQEGSISSMWDAYMDPWSAMTFAAKQEPEDEDMDDEVQRRCHPLACLFYPHFAFVHISRWLRGHQRIWRILFFILYLVYVCYAIIYNFVIKHEPYDVCDGAGLIGWTSAIILAYMALSRLYFTNRQTCSYDGESFLSGAVQHFTTLWKLWYIRLICYAAILATIFILTHKGSLLPSTGQIAAIGGYLVVLLIAYLFSVNPQHINWRLVVKNLVLQFIIVYGMIVWNFGRTLLQCSAEKIATFFSYGKQASQVVFSDDAHEMLAIELLCSLTLTGCYMHILYYGGLLQGFFHKLGFIFEHISGTTAVESICAALCTLVGGVEASVVLEPYIVLLTLSELHVFIVSGCTCMTGVTMSMYIHKGVNEVNLMTANFATYSGVIAVSKIVYPENEISVTTYHDLKFLDTDEYNLVDAAVSGACAVLRVLSNVIAGLIAMVSLVAMANSFVKWLLLQIGIPDVDIVTIVSVLVRPLIFLMGVEWGHSDIVARLFTIKTIRNENYAYTEMINIQNTMSKRELALTTALLYGFTNIAHMGVTTAFLVALAPERRRDISSTVPLATVTGILVNLLTASVIGILVVPHELESELQPLNTTNVTTSQMSPQVQWPNISNSLYDAAIRLGQII